MLDIEELVAQLPPHEKESGRRRISAAHKAGWTAIGLWTGFEKKDGQMVEMPPDQSDLMGVAPDSPYVQQLPY